MRALSFSLATMLVMAHEAHAATPRIVGSPVVEHPSSAAPRTR